MNCWRYSGCFQLQGQLTITVLCFRPPSPPIWIKWDVPSRMLEEMTTCEKPFTFSTAISLRRDCISVRTRSESWDQWPRPWFCQQTTVEPTWSARWASVWLLRKVPWTAVPMMVKPFPAFSWLVRDSRRGSSTFCWASTEPGPEAWWKTEHTEPPGRSPNTRLLKQLFYKHGFMELMCLFHSLINICWSLSA